jgi:excinuclease ABC subunit C
LETIPGIGEQTVVALMKEFKSVKRISQAKLEDLESVVGMSRAKKIVEFYKTK